MGRHVAPFSLQHSGKRTMPKIGLHSVKHTMQHSVKHTIV